MTAILKQCYNQIWTVKKYLCALEPQIFNAFPTLLEADYLQHQTPNIGLYKILYIRF